MVNTRSTSVLLITIILASLSTIAPFSIDTYLPSFPSIAYELNASAVQMQQSMSVYMLGFAVMTLFAGSLSDVLGRRNITIFSLAIYSLASYACVSVETIHSLLVLRFIQGVSASVGMVVGRAVIRDLYSGADAQRMMSNVMLFFAMAPALAPVVGGALETTYGWRSVFLFLMLLSASVMLLVFFKLPETLPREERHSLHPVVLLRNYIHAVTNLRFTALSFVIALNFGGFFVYVTASPRIIFTHLGLAADQFYLMFIPVVMGVMTGSFLSGRLSGRISAMALIKTGFGLMALSVLLNLIQAYILPPQPLTVIAPVVIYGVGVAIGMPALTIMGLDMMPTHRGLASSLQSFIHMGSNALVAGVVTPLVFDAINHLALTSLAYLCTGLGLFMLLCRGHNPPKQGAGHA